MDEEDSGFIETGRINFDASEAIKAKTSLAVERQSYVRDADWVKQSFIVDQLDSIDVRNRSYSSAVFKFTDSSLGGNFCINPPPQFTRYADLRERGMLPGALETTLAPMAGHKGMGRYYSEAIDDNNQIVHLSFGVPAYNSLTSFFTGFYNSSAAGLARTGRFDDSFFEKFIRFGAAVAQIALLPVLLFPIALTMAGQAYKFFMRIPSSKFAYLKRAMPLYWNAVTVIVNQISVNRGIVHYTDGLTTQVVGETVRVNAEANNLYSELLGPELTSAGLIDIYSVATKAKRLEARHRKEMVRQLESNPDLSWYGVYNKVFTQDSGLGTPGSYELGARGIRGFWDLWNKFTALSKTEKGLVERDMKNATPDVSGLDATAAEKLLKNTPYAPEKNPATFLEYFMATADEGADYASFRVDYTGSIQESFQNSTAPSALAEKINGASKSARDLKIDMAGGNIDPLGVSSAVLGAVGTVLSGVADVLHLGGLAVFAGNALVDIPEHWDAHTASLPKSTYTVQLVSPYGNPMSQMMNLYVPLAMLLAGALPLSTGKQSHQSPFLCELFDRGRCITKFGVIDSLTIQRGTGNMGFNREGQAMAIDVTFSVKDLSSVMSMPIQQGGSVMPLEGIFDMDNVFSDYMQAISGLSLRETYDRWPVLKRQLTLKRAGFESYFSKSRMAMAGADFMGIGTLMSVIMNSPGNGRGQRENDL